MVKLEFDMLNHPFLHPFSGIQPGFSMFFFAKQRHKTHGKLPHPTFERRRRSYHLRRFERRGLQQQLVCGSPGGFWSHGKLSNPMKKMQFFSGKIIYKWRFSWGNSSINGGFHGKLIYTWRIHGGFHGKIIYKWRFSWGNSSIHGVHGGFHGKIIYTWRFSWGNSSIHGVHGGFHGKIIYKWRFSWGNSSIHGVHGGFHGKIIYTWRFSWETHLYMEDTWRFSWENHL